LFSYEQIEPEFPFPVNISFRDGIALTTPQPTEWQRIGDEIDTAKAKNKVFRQR